MTPLHVDLESRSTVDLKKTGVYVYAVDKTTDVHCAAYCFDDGPIELWVPGEPCPPAIAEHVEAGGELWAHNAAFERIMWWSILTPRYGWPRPTREQFRCTMTMAYAMALPGSLENIPGALGLDIRKDMEGHRIMMQLAKPRKKDPLVWWEDPAKLQRLYDYCKTDVATERTIAKRLLRLTDTELALWHLDQKINDRGVYVDESLCAQAKLVVAQTAERLDREMSQVTGFEITGCTNVNQITTWLRKKGVDVDSIAKDRLEALLNRDDLAPDVRRVIELRREAAKASVAKIDALLRGRNSDGRARGLLQYHAAGTGRWGGRRFQPQNLKRPEKAHEKIIPDLVDAVMTGDARWVETLYGPPLTVVGDCTRSMVTAAPGHELVVADYSNIEGRVTAWLAGESWKVQAFRDFDNGVGPDLYLLAYSKSFGVSIEAAKPHRQIGKVMELALGYQGGVGAFQKMAVAYGVKVDDVQADVLKNRWREAHPNVRNLWYEMEDAARRAIESPGQVTSAADGRIRYKVKGGCMFMALPSGRCLCYVHPRLEWKEMPWTDESGKPARKLSIAYEGVDSTTGKWGRQFTYGGSLVENAVQAIARDVLAMALPKVEAAGYPVVLHVHDEIVSEVKAGFGSVEEFVALMTDLPPWAAGCPIAAAGWRGRRYKKA